METTLETIRVREARASDRDAIREVILAAYAQYERPLGDVWPLYREEVLKLLDDREADVKLVAEREGRVVGSGMVYPAGSTFIWKTSNFTVPYPELRLLAVAPEHCSQGVAAALMEAGIAHVRASGAEAVMFHTTPVMRAERLYARAGTFVRVPGFDVPVTPELSIEAYVMDLIGNVPAL